MLSKKQQSRQLTQYRKDNNMLNPHMFREYDIRGIAGKDMDAADVVLIGKAIGTYLRRQGNTDITVGRDCRVT